MFRNLSIARKMALASIPVLIALGAAAGKVVWDELDRVGSNRRTAMLAETMSDIVLVLEGIDAESKDTIGYVYDKTIDLGPIRQATNQSLNALEKSVRDLDDEELELGVKSTRETLTAIRERADGGIGADLVFAGFADAENTLLALSESIPGRVSDENFARQLKAIEKVALARTYGARQTRMIDDYVWETTILGPGGIPEVENRQAIVTDANRGQISDLNDQMLEALRYILATAPKDFYDRVGEAVEVGQINRATKEIDTLVDARPFSSLTVAGWDSLLGERQDALADLAQDLSDRVRSSASRQATARQIQAILLVGVALGVAIAASLVTLSMSRSIVRRIQSVAERAISVTENHLPALVEAISRPTDDASLPAVTAIRDSGGDEVGELARSFNALQTTLDDVARRQLSVLRKGVADIFVTLARRNRSLIDRQLSVIDELERGEEDPEKLGEYYRLDHLATRMRRNAESLLVLAGTESQRKWRKSTPIDDVIRAAIGEVEDYQRVDVLALEPLYIVGSAVSDMAHLLSEILDNATSFSPPNTRVRIAGHFDNAGYLLSVSDRGVGLGDKRLMELNEMLINPPVIGLALESTLGLFVVARLAQRHGIMVRLVHGSPGTTAQIILPPDLFQAATDSPRAISSSGQPAARLPGSTTPRPEAPAASAGTSTTGTGDVGPSRSTTSIPTIGEPAPKREAPSIPTIGSTPTPPPVRPAAPQPPSVAPTTPPYAPSSPGPGFGPRPAASAPSTTQTPGTPGSTAPGRTPSSPGGDGVVPGISPRPSLGGRLKAAQGESPTLPRRDPGTNFIASSDEEQSVARGRPAATTRTDLEAFRAGISKISPRPGGVESPDTTVSGSASPIGDTSSEMPESSGASSATTMPSRGSLFGRPVSPSGTGMPSAPSGERIGAERPTVAPTGTPGPSSVPPRSPLAGGLPTRKPGQSLSDDLNVDDDRIAAEKKAPAATRIALSAFQGAKERHEREET